MRSFTFCFSFCWFLFLLNPLQLLFTTSHQANFAKGGNGLVVDVKNGTYLEEKGALVVEEMVPMFEPRKEMVMILNETRRKLGSFQICSLCTCCGSGPKAGICLPTPCCYAINCNIPNRPFGFCSFTPKTCGCFDCNL